MADLARRALLQAAWPAGLLAAGTLGAAGLSRKWPWPAPARAGEPAPPPPFDFLDADGRTRTLADYRGRGVVLNFWASWCRPCVAELPSLDALAQALAPAGIVVLPLASDAAGPDAVRRFYADRGLHALPVLLDPGLRAGHLLGLQGLPTTLVIDRRGREAERFEGGMDWLADGMPARIGALAGKAGEGAVQPGNTL